MSCLHVAGLGFASLATQQIEMAFSFFDSDPFLNLHKINRNHRCVVLLEKNEKEPFFFCCYAQKYFNVEYRRCCYVQQDVPRIDEIIWIRLEKKKYPMYNKFKHLFKGVGELSWACVPRSLGSWRWACLNKKFLAS